MKKTKLSDQYTRCPHCSTLYALFKKIDLDGLATVSCGTCQNTFIAQDHLTQPKNKIIVPTKNNPYQTRLSPAIQNKTNHTTSAQTQQKSPLWRWALAGTGIFLGINLSIGAYVWLATGAGENPLTRNWINTLCGIVQCDPAKFYNPNTLQVEQHELLSDPQNPSQLQLKILVKNTSAFPQPLPTLQLQVDDLGGKSLETLRFIPAEYAPAQQGKLLSPGQTLNLTVAINQPIPELFSYKINFI